MAASTDDADVGALLAPAMAGDEAALEELFLTLVPRVRNLVRYLIRGDKDVDDLSQEALLKILRGLRSYRGDGAFTSWADRVAARTVFARLRRSPPTPVTEDVDQLPPSLAGADELPDSFYDRRRLVEMLDRLPSEQRDALVLHYVLGLSIKEVASELAAPEETVRSRMRLGKDRLKQWLGPRPSFRSAS